MSYFQEYERLRKSRELITVGSVWVVGLLNHKYEVVAHDFVYVQLKSLASGLMVSCKTENFLKLFKRVETQ